MSFATLALVCLVALLGPVLAAPRGYPVLVIVGELLVGIVLGKTGFGVLDPSDETFSLLAHIGFALVLFVAGAHVPVKQAIMRSGLLLGAARAALVGAIAAPLGVGLAALMGSDHGFLYAVLIASSSSSFVMPTVQRMLKNGADPAGGGRAEAESGDDDATRPDGEQRSRAIRAITTLVPQVAIADAVCIVLVPFALDPPRAGQAALGSALVLLGAGVVFLLLRWAERSGLRKRVHNVSEDRELAIELRASLTILFALAAIATFMQISVMLAGFAFGLALASIGPPRRLAKQLFALTEGFFAPIYYVWFGASVGLGAVFDHPDALVTGLALGACAVAAHLAAIVTRQRPSAAFLASAQLGVPVAAATTGLTLGVLAPGEDAALMIGALLTLVVGVFASRRTTKRAQALGLME